MQGGPPGSADAEGDRYIEIWNLVFMQFDRDEQGTLTPLPKPCVDTGMGLERLAAVLQHVHSNYEIDLFRDLIATAAKLTRASDLESPSLKVIADHIRACAFLIVDGVIPSNEGRGYVLRRIVRRAIRHGYKLGQKKPFFHKLVPELSRLMGDAYPELPRKQGYVAQVLQAEEERFAETLEHGMKILEAALAEAAQAGTLTCCRAKPHSRCTTPTAFRSISRPTSAASAASRSTRPGSTRRWTSSAGARAPRRRFKMAGGLEYRGAKTVFDGYDTLAEAGARGRHVPRRQRGRFALDRARGRRRPQPHAVLRGVRRPGRRSRRALARTARA